MKIISVVFLFVLILTIALAKTQVGQAPNPQPKPLLLKDLIDCEHKCEQAHPCDDVCEEAEEDWEEAFEKSQNDHCHKVHDWEAQHWGEPPTDNQLNGAIPQDILNEYKLCFDDKELRESNNAEVSQQSFTIDQCEDQCYLPPKQNLIKKQKKPDPKPVLLKDIIDCESKCQHDHPCDEVCEEAEEHWEQTFENSKNEHCQKIHDWEVQNWSEPPTQNQLNGPVPQDILNEYKLCFDDQDLRDSNDAEVSEQSFTIDQCEDQCYLPPQQNLIKTPPPSIASAKPGPKPLLLKDLIGCEDKCVHDHPCDDDCEEAEEDWEEAFEESQNEHCHNIHVWEDQNWSEPPTETQLNGPIPENILSEYRACFDDHNLRDSNDASVSQQAFDIDQCEDQCYLPPPTASNLIKKSKRPQHNKLHHN